MNIKQTYLLMLALIQSLFACGQQSYEQKLASLYNGTVPLIKPKELTAEMKSDKLYILDTRSAAEYSVSHLPNAQFVDYDDFKVENINFIPKDAEVVVYCSVGYRSERIGEKLKKAGYNNVKNLYGGIFEWKNQDFEVFNPQGEVTDSVHTYNRRWGKWLKDGKGIKVYD